ncbi:type VI secretion system protein TssA [Alsobacter sp. SYSU BS001988]
MTPIDYRALEQPLKPGDPCGPDLDLEGDDDYLNFFAVQEGVMPATFFVDGQPFAFDPSIVDVDELVAKIGALLSRTRDLRLVMLLARLSILNGNLAEFSRSVVAGARMLELFWDETHPRAENGSLAMRAATLGTLDESTVAFSLQYVRLCESRRAGPVNLRSFLYARREAEPRPGEETPTESTILQTLRDAAEQTAASRAAVEATRAALDRIGALWAERADILTAPRLSNIRAVLTRILALIDLALPPETAAASEPGAAPSLEAETASAPQGGVGSGAQAAAALQGAYSYFQACEPSSPVLPLLAQAQALLGKSFIEVLQILLPDHVGSAAYQIGGRHVFPLPVGRLADLSPASEAADEGWGETSAESEADGGPGVAHGGAPGVPAARDGAAIGTRAQALAALDQVAAWMRAQEPSSPVPWLIERASALAGRDFLSVLRAVLPPDALSDLDQGS